MERIKWSKFQYILTYVQVNQWQSRRKVYFRKYFNLAACNIAESEINVFCKGLDFAPTPKKINRWQL